MDKKGSSVVALFGYAFAVFFFLIFFGLAVWGFSIVNDIFDQDVEIGQVNLRDTNDITFGAIATALLNQADLLALVVVLSMVILMMLTAFFFGNSNKMWIPIDILILIFVFILSVYLSNVYEILINSSDLIEVYIENLPKASRFMLNLPSIVATIGALLMIITYTKIGQDQRRETNVLGFQ